MLRTRYEDLMVGTPRTRRFALLLIGAGALALAAFMVWVSPGGNAGYQRGSGSEGSVGTSGQDSGENSGPALSTIRDLETITGTNDGHEFVGRRVDVHAPVQQHVNDVAFWVGPSGNRLLVVLARDNRNGTTRQQGEPASTGIGIGEIQPGQQATISGTVQRVPYAEAMYSWGLTNADRAELMDRPIYLRADSVTANGAAGTSGQPAAPASTPAP